MLRLTIKRVVCFLLLNLFFLQIYLCAAATIRINDTYINNSVLPQESCVPEKNNEPAGDISVEKILEEATVGQHLVIGSTEMIGEALTHELISKNLRPSLFVAKRREAYQKFFPAKNIDVYEGDPETDVDALVHAAQGKKYIYLCMSFPYHLWEKQSIRVTRNVIFAAQCVGATVVFPSVFYVIGAAKKSVYTEKDATNPCCTLGKAFKRVEESLFAASQNGTCKAIVVRHGLPFGPYFCDGLMSALFESALKKDAFSWLNRTDLPFQFCYVFDIARILVDLAIAKPPVKSASSVHYELFNFGGYALPTVKHFLDLVAHKMRMPCKTTLYGKRTLSLLAPLHRDAAAGKDIFYSFEKSVLLDDSKLMGELKKIKGVDYTLTPLDEAIKATLLWFHKNTK